MKSFVFKSLTIKSVNRSTCPEVLDRLVEIIINQIFKNEKKKKKKGILEDFMFGEGCTV